MKYYWFRYYYKGIPLDRETITKVINDIISIEIDDNIKLEIENIKDIREEETYSGFNANLKAEFGFMSSF